MSSRPRLRRLHPDSTILSNSSSVSYWKLQSDTAIAHSLRPGGPAPLRVKSDGTIMDGNTRIYVLELRGYDINKLPFESYDSGNKSYFFDM